MIVKYSMAHSNELRQGSMVLILLMVKLWILAQDQCQSTRK